MRSGSASRRRRPFTRSVQASVRTATLLSSILALAAPLQAQTRRALLIGINTYHYGPELASRWRAALPREALVGRGASSDRRGDMPDLDGAVNDAREMARVLAGKYQFRSIDTVYEERASREGILAAIRRLVDVSRPGDVVVFYYAGHGSQRYNSAAPASVSANRLDQTIVPADANVGQFDIRNIELTALFDQLLAKDVQLTLIFDSCNSGSAVRGVAPPKVRFAPFDPRDAADPSDPESLTRPGRRNPALFLAAAQENQSASEQADGLHGAFTGALLRVMTSAATPVNAPARQIFRQVEAMLRWSSMEQVPVLKGTDGGGSRPLFGTISGPAARYTVLALQGMIGPRRDTAVLEGGAALGIGTGTELRLLDDSNAVRLKVVSSDPGTSRAVVVSGTVRAAPGTAYVVDKWVLPGTERMRTWVPRPLGAAQLAAAAASLGALRTGTVAEWVSDPSAVPQDERPLFTVMYDAGQWVVRTPFATTVPLASPSTAAVSEAIATQQAHIVDSVRADQERRRSAGLPAPANPGRPRVFVMLPPSDSLLSAMRRSGFGSDGALGVSERPDSATYMLVGRIDSSGASYAWMLRDATPQSIRRSPLPARTEWFPSSGATSSQLVLWGGRLARLDYWQTVPSHSTATFPYHLALRRVGGAAVPDKMQGDTVPNHGGEQYALVLKRDTTVHGEVTPQWVYVFTIDRTGLGGLLFGQSANQLPASPGPRGTAAPAEIVLPMRGPVSICPTYGTDTFVLVAASHPIGSPEATFDFPTVMKRTGVVGSDVSGDEWSVERVWLRSMPPAASDERLVAQGVKSCRTSRQIILDPGSR